MTNHGVTGSVVDAASPSVGIAGLTAAVYYIDPLGLFDDRLLDRDETTASGSFSLTYDAFDFNPNLRVRVFDPVQRLLHLSTVFPNVSAPVFALPAPIALHSADVDGWIVTGGTGKPLMLTTGNTITALIDNAAAWSALTTSVKAATGWIRLLLHYFDVENVILAFNSPYAPTPANYEGVTATGDRLETLLLDANRRPRALPVSLVINDFPLPYPVDTAGALEEYLEDQQDVGSHTIELARFQVPQVAPMHAKVVIVEEAARTRGFIPASGLIQEYFDDRSHRIDDPRRGEMGWANQIKVPVHDVSVAVEGPAVNDFDRTVRLHWDAVNPASPMPALVPTPSPTTPAPTAVQVCRTLPANRFPPPLDQGETGILEAYQRAFLNAEDFIYLETQYFTEPVLADSLILALRRRPSLVAILLINNAVDVPFYNGWQQDLVQRFLSQVSSDGATNRVGVFCLWTHEQAGAPAKDRIIRNYVHSKTAVVDDKWATIGSANIEGTGLNRAQHISWLPESYTAITRGVEVNLVVFDGLNALPSSSFPADLRRDLWAEHLGYDSATHTDLVDRPTDPAGWLSLWTGHADAKLAGLKATPPSTHRARILAWQPEKDPDDFLEALDVDLELFTVETEVRDFDLNTGTWD